MKKVAFISVAVACCLLSCKNQNAKKENTNGTKKDSVQNSGKSIPTTHSELSIRKGDNWEPKKYGGGGYKQVDTLSLPEEHTDHSYFIRFEGPGWENKHIAYRMYLDWRNAFDIYGKKVDTLVLPYVGRKDFESYHHAAPWGQDILNSGKALGIGGYGRWMNDSVAHFRRVFNTFTQVHNTDKNASVTINYEQWKTGKDTLDLKSNISISNDDRYMKVQLEPSKAIQGLCTGLVKYKDMPLMKKTSPDGKWTTIYTYGTQTLVNDTDKLGLALMYKNDEIDKLTEGKYDHVVIFKPTTEKITYYLMAAWEEEMNGIKSKDAFEADLDQKLKELDNNGSLND